MAFTYYLSISFHFIHNSFIHNSFIHNSFIHNSFVSFYLSIFSSIFLFFFLCLLRKGEWVGDTAGGCANQDTVVQNPQYLLTVTQQAKVRILLLQSKFGPGILSLLLSLLFLSNFIYDLFN